MKLLTFRRKDNPDQPTDSTDAAPDKNWRLGVRLPMGVVDIAAAAATRKVKSTGVPLTPDELFMRGDEGLSELAEFSSRSLRAIGPEVILPEATLEIGPAVPNPGKIIGIGLNYRRHAAETGSPEPATPVIFAKFNNTIAAPDETIPLPKTAEQYDYEVELAVVIGKTCRDVSESEALDYVLGYCTCNDLTARDLQNTTSQWILGKSLDKFYPLGPYLVTRDQVPDPQMLALKTIVNGELRQSSNTSDMIFTVAQIVSYISRYWTLMPGDVISTGTPEGVILGMTDKVWLKSGDVVSVEVEGLGTLTNVMG